MVYYTSMFFTGIGTAVPAQRFTQGDCWEALQSEPRFFKLSSYSQGLLKRILLGTSGIRSRHLAIDNLSDMFELSPDALHARFRQNAPQLASQSAKEALLDAGLAAEQIDAVIVSTCTGYLCPGLSSYVIEDLGLKPDVQALDLVGQGCGAALPNLRTAEALLKAGSAQNVLCVCVEICSAAFYWDEDPGVLVSACLFGDGAAAVVASNSPAKEKQTIQWMTAESLTVPENRDYLRFEQRGGMLRNILTQRVPALAAKHAEQVLNRTLTRAGLKRADISQWIFHPGGPDVLHALQTRLELSTDDFRHSAEILRDYGNLSSPCVLFALKKALKESPKPGHWWMSSFGAGFSCHGALLRVD